MILCAPCCTLKMTEERSEMMHDMTQHGVPGNNFDCYRCYINKAEWIQLARILKLNFFEWQRKEGNIGTQDDVQTLPGCPDISSLPVQGALKGAVAYLLNSKCPCTNFFDQTYIFLCQQVSCTFRQLSQSGLQLRTLHLILLLLTFCSNLSLVSHLLDPTTRSAFAPHISVSDTLYCLGYPWSFCQLGIVASLDHFWYCLLQTQNSPQALQFWRCSDTAITIQVQQCIYDQYTRP